MVAAMKSVLVCATLAMLGAVGIQDPGQVVEPELVVPGEWLTDRAEKFLFLPFTVPADIRLDNCKLMSNGEQLLVVVTEAPQEEPDTQALRKYKLIMEALKQEAGHDEHVLTDKLRTWLETEDDDEVRTHIRAALDSLVKVKQAKSNTKPRKLTVPLGLLAKARSSAMVHAHNGMAEPQETAEELVAERSLASVHRATQQKTNSTAQSDLRVGIIKESFAVEIPFPVDTEQMFVLKADQTTLIASMPLVRKSLAASGISTGGKPFDRLPVFAAHNGAHLAGPWADLKRLAFGLSTPSVAKQTGLKKLTA